MPFNSFLDYPMSWKPEREKLRRPIYLSLAEQLEKEIAGGFLVPGTKLTILQNQFSVSYTSCIIGKVLHALGQPQ